MPFNTPIYRYKFNGSFLPGYAQQESLDFPTKSGGDDVANRNGGVLHYGGASLRPANLTLSIYSRLSAGSGLDHLNDLKDQVREALRICARVKGEAELRVGDMDRYLIAVFTGLQNTLSSSDGKKGIYVVSFMAQPIFYGDTAETDTIAGDGTLSVTTTDTAETYPVFTIASTVTAAVLTAPDGRTLTFTRGSVTGNIEIDCGRLTAKKTSDGTNVTSTITEVDFGFSHEGAGTFDVGVSGYAGSGDIDMSLTYRYER